MILLQNSNICSAREKRLQSIDFYKIYDIFNATNGNYENASSIYAA